jgi:hypothetical protein
VAFDHVQNGIDKLLARMLASTTALICRLKARLNQQPFFFLQIARIAHRQCPEKGLTLFDFLLPDSF